MTLVEAPASPPTNSPPPPQGPLHYFLGFNHLIDRGTMMRLLSTVGAALDNGARSITLCLSSLGGFPEQAFYAYEILRSLPVELTTHNVGSVQSAAMPLFLAGTRRLAVPEATFLMHKTVHHAGNAPLGVDHLSNASESIQADDKRAISVVAERTGNDLGTVTKWFQGQKLRSAEFAKTVKIVTDITPVHFPELSRFIQVVVS